MLNIQAGAYTVKEVLDRAKFDFEVKAAADYLSGKPDYRRVKIGGLSFDSLDDVVVIPYTANDVVITLDGKSAVKLVVDLDEEDQEWRRRSFESAAEAEDN